MRSGGKPGGGGTKIFPQLMKLIKACCYLARPGCLFLATNRDHAELVAPGRVLPVTGSLLAAVETGAARQATVLGKPSPFILRCIAATSPGGPWTRRARSSWATASTWTWRSATRAACGACWRSAASPSLEDARGCLAEPARRHHVPDFYIESVADLLGAAQIRANPGAGSGEGEGRRLGRRRLKRRFHREPHCFQTQQEIAVEISGDRSGDQWRSQWKSVEIAVEVSGDRSGGQWRSQWTRIVVRAVLNHPGDKAKGASLSTLAARLGTARLLNGTRLGSARHQRGSVVVERGISDIEID
ncbi:unnamed protein product [Lampetra fluviatilis]